MHDARIIIHRIETLTLGVFLCAAALAAFKWFAVPWYGKSKLERAVYEVCRENNACAFSSTDLIFDQQTGKLSRRFVIEVKKSAPHKDARRLEAAVNATIEQATNSNESAGLVADGIWKKAEIRYE